MIRKLPPPAITGTDKKVISGQATTLTCTVTDISEAPKEVRWTKSDIAGNIQRTVTDKA